MIVFAKCNNKNKNRIKWFYFFFALIIWKKESNLKILVSVDPVDIGSNVGVDSGELGLAAGNHAPWHDTGEHMLIAAFNGASQRAARVTLKKRKAIQTGLLNLALVGKLKTAILPGKWLPLDSNRKER